MTTVGDTWSGLVEALSIGLGQVDHGSMQSHEYNQKVAMVIELIILHGNQLV